MAHQQDKKHCKSLCIGYPKIGTGSLFWYVSEVISSRVNVNVIMLFWHQLMGR